MHSPPRPLLTSTANPRVKAAAALRDRRERDRTGLTVVDGAREVRRSLDGGATVVEAFICEPLLAGEDARVILDRLASSDATVHHVTEAVFDRVSFGERAEGVVAVVRIPSLDLADLVLPEDPLVVVVEGVEKPGNVGAVLRSVDGAGADALVAADARTDLFNPNAIRASLGAEQTRHGPWRPGGGRPQPAMIAGDPARLRQLVMILVDNAIRHSPTDGRVAVQVRTEGLGAELVVEDDGPGIRPEDLPHVFERFYRAQGAPGGGTGLGLAIASWIVNRHGGRIEVANRTEGGARFVVHLPATGTVTS